MPNSASQEANVVMPSQASNIMSYDQYWQGHNAYGTASPQDQFFVRLMNFFTGEDKRVQSDYEAYVQNTLNNMNRLYEDKATQSARAWDEYMSSSQYSRAFEDLKKAGVNPYMLLQSGGVQPASYGSSAKADFQNSYKSSIKDTKTDTKGRDFALVLLAIARLISAL